MSYSLTQKCWSCTKQEKCLDGTIISVAVSAIHALGTAKGHLGSGSIDHNCNNYEDRYTPKPE